MLKCSRCASHHCTMSVCLYSARSSVDQLSSDSIVYSQGTPNALVKCCTSTNTLSSVVPGGDLNITSEPELRSYSCKRSFLWAAAAIVIQIECRRPLALGSGPKTNSEASALRPCATESRLLRAGIGVVENL